MRTLANCAILAVEGPAAFRDMIQSGTVSELSDPLGRIGGYMNEAISASDLMTAERIRRILQKKMADLYSEVDVLVTPFSSRHRDQARCQSG